MRSDGLTARRRRRGLSTVAVAASLTLMGSACSSSQPDDPAAFCDALRGTAAVNGSIATIDIDDSTSLDMAMLDLEHLVEVAPEEIDDDIETVVTVYTEALRSLASTAPGARTDVLREMQERLDEAGVPARAVQDYGESTCDITFVEPPQPTPTPPPLDIDD